MKKRVIRTITLVLFIILMFSLSSCKSDADFSRPHMSTAKESPSLTRIIDPDSEVRGVWIASVWNIDFPSRTDLTADEMKSEIDDIISTCKASGLNTVYFQVRPSCDALYDSDIFPVSSYLSSDGELYFDPLGYFTRAAHENNIFLYAWVNPLRVTADGRGLDALADSSPAKQNPDWVVEYDGKLYLDPGIPEVRSLVADGVREIIRKYAVDGVVFDDYFYPYPVYDSARQKIDFDDADTFAAQCGDFTNVEDWRRDNVNKMIKACYDAVHETCEDCTFGVSPFGVWQNNNGKNGGSDTANLEAYSELYCDALAWADGGYVDFLSPQLYWTFESYSSPFDVILRWWNARLDGTGVKLIVSHGMHNYNGGWDYPKGKISQQIVYARSEKMYYGSVCYGYSVLKANIEGAADELRETYSDEIVYTSIMSNGGEVCFSSPVNDSVTYDGKTFLIGSCDPAYPLTLDGAPVSMTKSGYFSLFMTLDEGENVFVFEQNGRKFEYRITYKTSYDSVEGEKTPVTTGTVDAINIYPSSSVAVSDETLWVQCYAPYGSKVTASVGGISTELEPLTEPVWADSGYTCILYGGETELPHAPDGMTVDCGDLSLTVSHADGTVTKNCARVRVLGDGAYLTVRAKGDYTELKITESSLYYNDYTVQSAGMTDYADALSDGFYHLRMGGYVYESAVEEIDAELHDKCRIKSVKVSDDGERTSIVFEAEDNLPYNATVDGGAFVVTLYNADAESAAEAEIGENPFFDSCTVVRLDGKVRYSFPLFSEKNFYGFDLAYGDGCVTVTLRDPMRLDLSSDKMLDGLVIVLDAGHGGAEYGALGARAGSFRADEKDINLAIVLSCTEKLRSLGADVRLTRDDDETFVLSGSGGRVKYLEELEPDLCISIHQNSDEYYNDITRIRGTLGLWCMDGGNLLAECISKAVAKSLGRMWQDSRYQMLAMCRNPKFPAALIEVGYMTSVEEYEMMTTRRGVEKASDGVVEGIIEYFRRQSEWAR